MPASLGAQGSIISAKQIVASKGLGACFKKNRIMSGAILNRDDAKCMPTEDRWPERYADQISDNA